MASGGVLASGKLVRSKLGRPWLAAEVAHEDRRDIQVPVEEPLEVEELCGVAARHGVVGRHGAAGELRGVPDGNPHHHCRGCRR